MSQEQGLTALCRLISFPQSIHFRFFLQVALTLRRPSAASVRSSSNSARSSVRGGGGGGRDSAGMSNAR